LVSRTKRLHRTASAPDVNQDLEAPFVGISWHAGPMLKLERLVVIKPTDPETITAEIAELFEG